MWIGVAVDLQPRCSYRFVPLSYWVLSGGIFVPGPADGWNRKAGGGILCRCGGTGGSGVAGVLRWALLIDLLESPLGGPYGAISGVLRVV